MTAKVWAAELHCHSEYSRDCNVSLSSIIALCQHRGISIIALTDHNEIAGAQRLQRLAPDWLTVIVGEEIATAEGDVIGLYLTAKIPARLPIDETIQKIKDQGGLVLIPHPFDRIRREAIGKEVLDRTVDQADAIEIFNSRCLLRGDNRRAANYAKSHGAVAFVGSDAHVPREYGRSRVLFKRIPTTAGEFMTALKNADLAGVRSDAYVHWQTWRVKRTKA